MMTGGSPISGNLHIFLLGWERSKAFQEPCRFMGIVENSHMSLVPSGSQTWLQNTHVVQRYSQSFPVKPSFLGYLRHVWQNQRLFPKVWYFATNRGGLCICLYHRQDIASMDYQWMQSWVIVISLWYWKSSSGAMTIHRYDHEKAVHALIFALSANLYSSRWWYIYIII